MRFHGVEMMGPFWAQKVATLPTWSAADEARLVYSEFDKKYYQANNTRWVELSTGLHTHAGVYLPVGGKAVDSELLDGINSTSYARLDIANTFAATQNLQDNLLIRPEIKDYSETFVDTGTGTDYTFNLENGNVFKRIVNGNSIFVFSNPPATGKVGSFSLFLVNGASFSITYPTSVTWPNGISPILGSNTTSLMDILTFVTFNGGVRWYGNVATKKLPV